MGATSPRWCCSTAAAGPRPRPPPTSWPPRTTPAPSASASGSADRRPFLSPPGLPRRPLAHDESLRLNGGGAAPRLRGHKMDLSVGLSAFAVALAVLVIVTLAI